ncbi:MAG: 2-polyprenylphenol 6-hydroxylase [Alphaproteobacteria bacterium]|nr:2-polyprenylphenol 6-hydroxylase [Alphaproteobacteria bacterium]
MLKPFQNFLRLIGIAKILAKHRALEPLGLLMEASGFTPATVFIGRILAKITRKRNGSLHLKPGELRPGQRLAAALAELGPASIKLGQILSTRSDLIGASMAADLAMLRDRLEPFSFDKVRQIVETELDQPLENIFVHFDPRPISAASIAQVHYAILPASQNQPEQKVAVKVLRPDIQKAFARDLELFFWMARIIEKTRPRLRRLRPVAIIETFAQIVDLEMDLRLEAAAASELAQNFEGDPTYHIPKIFWEYTSHKVMVQERIEGIAIDDKNALQAAGLNVDDILKRAAAIFFRQVFRDGYFHGDQHPGNMFVNSQGIISPVDFGIMGRLDQKTRYFLADMLMAFLKRDYRKVAEIHREAGYISSDQPIDLFAQACRSIGEPISGKTLTDISFARLLAQLFSIAERFDMKIQPQLLLLQKNMLMAEGISRYLNPNLNLWGLAYPLIVEWMREHRGIEARVIESIKNFNNVVDSFPRLLKTMEKIEYNLEKNNDKNKKRKLIYKYKQKTTFHLMFIWFIIFLLYFIIIFKL